MIDPDTLTDLERAALDWHVARANHSYVTLCGIRANAGLETEDRRVRQFSENLVRTILKMPDAHERIAGFVRSYTAHLEERFAAASRSFERGSRSH